MYTRSSLVDETAESLRQLILSGQLRPGEYLPSQKRLAARFGVGTSTIHEAVQVLVAVGLLRSRPGKGTWVREDATEGLIHPDAVRARLGELKAPALYEARAVIEVELTEKAALRASREEVQRIRNALEAMRETVTDTDAFVRADLEFHTAVAVAGHNELLAQFYQLSRALLLEGAHDLVSMPGVVEESIEIQAEILRAIEQGDAVRARQAALEHMHYISRLLERQRPAGEQSTGSQRQPTSSLRTRR